ncbi:hypothetical protein JR316_0003861 [Psilocybe cubensis]|uniref:Uncharacterized protein n=2 Tax=Psilocybe cubensis TaxID=181762 RepID=A0ACB8H9I3_PSICU|nr:hypothetical protein JR316_0003861 [Psilocybe cubensis]KAH9484380.1 hypothetical protein JR316_0003861 [Psilocybe cubensis]
MSNPAQTSSKKLGKRKAQDDPGFQTLADDFDQFVQRSVLIQMVSRTVNAQDVEPLFLSSAPRSMQWAIESGLIVLSSSSSTLLFTVMGGMSPGIIVCDSDKNFRIALDQKQLECCKTFIDGHRFRNLKVDKPLYNFLHKKGVDHSVFQQYPNGELYILYPESYPPGLTHALSENTLAVNECLTINRDLQIEKHIKLASGFLTSIRTPMGRIGTFKSPVVHQSPSQIGANKSHKVQGSANGSVVPPSKKPRTTPTHPQQQGPTIPVPSYNPRLRNIRGNTDHTLMPPPQIPRQHHLPTNSQTARSRTQSSMSLSKSSQPQFPDRYDETGMGIHSSPRARSTATSSLNQLVRQNSEPNFLTNAPGGFLARSVHTPETAVPNSFNLQGNSNPLQTTAEAGPALMPEGRYGQTSTVHHVGQNVVAQSYIPNVAQAYETSTGTDSAVAESQHSNSYSQYTESADNTSFGSHVVLLDTASGSFSQVAVQTASSAIGAQDPTINDTYRNVGSYQNLAIQIPALDTAALIPTPPLVSNSTSQSGTQINSGSAGTPNILDHSAYAQDSANPAFAHKSLVQNSETQEGDIPAGTYQQTQGAEMHGGVNIDSSFDWDQFSGLEALSATDVSQFASGSIGGDLAEVGNWLQQFTPPEQ